MRGAVDARCLAEFLRDGPEEAMEDEHLIGDAEGEIEQDDAGIGVDQPEAVHQREDRRQHHLEGDHRAEQHQEQDQLAEAHGDLGQRIAPSPTGTDRAAP